MQILTKTFVLLFLCCAALTVQAQKKDYTREPGYVEFGDLSALETEEGGTEVLLEAHLLKMAAKMAGGDDPEVASLLNGLQLVKVNQYEVSERNEAKIRAKVQEIEKEIAGKGWDRIIYQKSKTENTSVYIKTRDGQQVIGLVIVSYKKGEEAVFVNIVGNIDMDKIGKISDNIGVPELRKIKAKKK